MDILRTDTAEQFVRTATQWITGVILEAQHDGKTATIGLSGGSTPKPVYALLCTEQSIDWKRVRFFLLDERYVLADHPDSNTRMIRDTLLKQEAANTEFIAPDTSLPLDRCIAAYERTVSTLKPDLVLLGMGEDGHIAGLFPPVGPEAYGPTTVIHTTTDTFAVHDRISLAFPILLHAQKRLFLISGATKAALLQKMQQTNEDVSLYPAQYLLDERTVWIVGAY